ncbi:chitooligosaccharidolytic beta-N-acetylglucosaminidase isoform X2 [Anoplophora glabripennis]|uniref:chitooligosaccharidolytic beta-N-acetylglucosaminidase isoform X2 n=1 Tax=Anoplophora glabripennis TaxID=217634 RepID=UPI000873ABEB|nr:chitooligosaccharidolytic beta-N-acetylglucosaminidase isoform X2 [Anoplophora glabripennis]
MKSRMGEVYPVIFLVCLMFGAISGLSSVWSWQCEKGYCQKKLITNETENTALSLPACRLFCSQSAALWPKPTGTVSVGNFLAKINVNSIDVEGIKSETTTTDLAQAAAKIFKEQIRILIPKNVNPTGGKSLIVNLDIQNPNINKITLELDESYTLQISESSDGRLKALITAATFFGARHGLQTLNQLIIYDDLRDELQVPRDASVTDKPAYPHRGILLDTSRNYVTVDTIKKTIKGMGASKMNTFHWHITDSHSFPYVSQSQPRLSKLGAYSPTKIYSPSDVAEIIQYGKERGVRVMPEFDAPAHVGEGWQDTGLVTCFNWQPWQSYCVEPPCGQFDPTKSKLYDVIEDIYGDMIAQFQPDIFHMGGDEVNFNCWNSTDSIVEWMAKEKGWGRTEADFVKLWDYFQTQALERLYKKAGGQIPAIMWTSTLTQKEYVLDHLSKDKYIIQIWTTGNDEQVTNLLDNGYKLILSNYDALYLDCGFAGWVTDGNNWCSPYIGWQKVYDNKPASIAGSRKDQILGAEATLWTEQVDTTAIDSRLWPRAAALAEVLWTEPTTDWKVAEQRFLVHRERLVTLGIDADGIEPQWCLQNEENCRIGAVFNTEHK